MKRQILYYALTLIVLTTGWPELSAKSVVINGLKYTISDSKHEAMLEDFNTWTGELVIPSEINNDEQIYTVTEISWRAFDDCKTLTKVRIPKTVREIWHYTGSKDLCTNPFNGCTNLESIEVDEDNEVFCSVDGVLFKNGMTLLCSYPGGKKQQSYTVPDNVTRLGTCAFSGNPYLMSIKIPDTVTRINYAFRDCENLEVVNLPNGLKSLSAFLFRNCKSLKSIEIPDGVEKIEEQVFLGCTSLSVIDIPASVYSIGGIAFYGCKLDALVIRGHINGLTPGMGVFGHLDTSTPLYVPASDIEMYKAAYSGPVLPLESYTTEIAMPNKAKNSSTLFDLQGRRLQKESAQGIYIRDGRKYIGK